MSEPFFSPGLALSPQARSGFSLEKICVRKTKFYATNNKKGLLPLREQVYGWLFSKARLHAIERHTIYWRTRFPAEKKHYQVTNPLLSGYSLVDWGGTSLKRMNLFVTVEALSLLKTSSAGGSLSSSAQAKS